MCEIIENTGMTIHSAIKITNCVDNFSGIDAEYTYVTKIYGQRGVDWKLKKQSLLNENNRIYDKLELEFNGEKEPVIIFFDITEFFGLGFHDLE